MAVERAANIRVGIAQIGTAPISHDFRHIRDNTDKIIASLQKARTLPNEKIDLLVFPELAIPSYWSKDFFNRRDYLRANKEALERICPETMGITAIVGFADYDETKLGPDGRMMRYNSAAVIRDGEIVGVIDKTHLPEYGPFRERRYFSDPREEHKGYNNIIEVNGKKIGIQICEDIWQDGPDVTKLLKDNGAEMIVNLSASPFYIDRFDERLELLKRKSAEHDTTIVFANAVGAQEHLVFDGQSMVVRKGELVAKGKAFEEDFVIFDSADHNPELIVPPVREEEQMYKALVLSIKTYFEKVKREKGIEKAVIGLSGGIDSAVTAALAVEALGAENIIGVALPSLPSSEESVIDAEELADRLRIEFIESPIRDSYKIELASARKDLGREPDSLTKQNIQARLRGNRLMTIAGAGNAMVINTGNKTELALGYCTMYGDMIGAVAPLADLNKLRVRALAKYINEMYLNEKERIPPIPLSTITKKSSAELEEGQTDEESLGASYEDLSPLVDALLEDNPDMQALSDLYGSDLVKRIYRLIMTSEYKRRQGPFGIRVTKTAFGSDNQFPL